jgi:hypothetical protein
MIKVTLLPSSVLLLQTRPRCLRTLHRTNSQGSLNPFFPSCPSRLNQSRLRAAFSLASISAQRMHLPNVPRFLDRFPEWCRDMLTRGDFSFSGVTFMRTDKPPKIIGKWPFSHGNQLCKVKAPTSVVIGQPNKDGNR